MKSIDELIAKYCPDGVEYKPLGRFGDFYGGLTGKCKDDFGNGNAKFISYMNVYSNPATKLEVPDMVKIGQTEKQNQIQHGDVLFTGSSETPEECAMSSVVTTDVTEPIYLNSFCFGFRFFDKSLYLPDFLKHLLRGETTRKQLYKTASGVTRFNVSKQKIANVIIPRPHIEVQKEIVRILDGFTGLIAELEAELAARRKQYEQYRDKLLTFNDNVERIPLGQIGRVAMCKRIFQYQTSSNGDVPFYKIGTFGETPDAFISKELFNEYKGKFSYPKKGAVLLSAAGTIGKAIVFNGDDSYFQDSNIVWLEHDESIALNKYLFYCYQLSPWKIASGGTVSRLYNANIEKAVIPLPSLPEQRRIVEILDRFDALCNDKTAGLAAEIAARKKQYEYYRDRLLTFKRKEAV